ncbi:MAG: ATP-binding protein [Anaerolineaceae bacterium]|nr:ATP-binding protein [Anaerolineaceae bacterium]
MRQSLRWRMALPYIFLLIVSLGGLGLFISNYVSNTYLNNQSAVLLNETRTLASIIAPDLQQGPPYSSVNKLNNQFANLLKVRGTIILPNGVVVGESSTDPNQLDNHLDRPEIQKALQGQEDSETRYSDTLKIEMMYAAIPIKQANQIIGVARLAVPLSLVQSNMKVIGNTIVGTAFVTILLAMLLAIVLTNYTILPLRRLTETVNQMDSGAVPQPSPSERLDEIGRLDRAFSLMASRLNTQIKELTGERGKLAMVLAKMTDGILIVDGNGCVQLINPAAQRLFKVSETDAIGHTLVEVIRNHQLVELWQTCLRSGEQQTTTLETAPDRLFVQGIAIPLPQNLPGSTLLVYQDLTRVRRLEIVRRDFISNVSHELRTPLASLKALTETLMEGALEDPPAARRFLVQMDTEVDNLTQMVQELLELTRIESGKVPLNQISIQPYELLKPAVDRMQLQAERAGLNLHMESLQGLPSVKADPERIEQVLVNLLHNAIKFTLPGGEIIVSAYQSENMITFFVKDNGVGIDPDALTRIFERFYKADRSRSGRGTGLGLSIARHLIEAHGGRIWAESEIGQGSKFYFTIPTA